VARNGLQAAALRGRGRQAVERRGTEVDDAEGLAEIEVREVGEYALDRETGRVAMEAFEHPG
jgi:hypothetical protein